MAESHLKFCARKRQQTQRGPRYRSPVLRYDGKTHSVITKQSRTQTRQGGSAGHGTTRSHILSGLPSPGPHAEFWSLPSTDKQTNWCWRSPEAIRAHHSPTITCPFKTGRSMCRDSSWDLLKQTLCWRNNQKEKKEVGASLVLEMSSG